MGMNETDTSSATEPKIAQHPLRCRYTSSMMRILQAIQLLDRPVILGASGGVDSTAMMLLLADAQIPTLLVHVHHHLRQDADNDAAVVAQQAKSLGLPLHTVHLTPPPDDGHENIAQRSRQLRYDALTSFARTHDAIVITAHHANDLLETFLMRTSRGVGLPRAFGLQADHLWNGVRVHRPLLGVWKDDLYALVQKASFPWIEDTSNASDAYARNRLRHAMTPLTTLLQQEPRFAETLAHLAQEAALMQQSEQDVPPLSSCVQRLPTRWHAGANDAWVPRRAAMQHYQYDRARFQQALYAWCGDHAIMPRRDVLRAVATALWDGIRFQRDMRGLALCVHPDGMWLRPGGMHRPGVPQVLSLSSPPVLLTRGQWCQVGAHDLLLRTAPDGLRVYARPLRAGDRFPSPHSGRMMGVRKRLTKDGVPSELREQAVVVIVDGDRQALKDLVKNPNLVSLDGPLIIGVVAQHNESLEIPSQQGMPIVVENRSHFSHGA